jgi:hypothetical protein
VVLVTDPKIIFTYPPTTTIEEMVAAADASHAQYPQYAGHWDGWVMAVARRSVRSRGKEIVAKNEPVLFDPASRHDLVDFDDDPKSIHATFNKRLVGVEFGTFYLPRNLGGIDTSLRTDYFEIQEGNPQ